MEWLVGKLLATIVRTLITGGSFFDEAKNEGGEEVRAYVARPDFGYRVSVQQVDRIASRKRYLKMSDYKKSIHGYGMRIEARQYRSASLITAKRQGRVIHAKRSDQQFHGAYYRDG